MLIEYVQEFVGRSVASEWAAAAILTASALFLLYVLKRIFFGRG